MKFFFSLVFLLFSILPTLLFSQQSWEKLNGLYGGTVRDIKMDRRGRLYAAVDGGLYCSTDMGKNWSKVTNDYYSAQTVSQIYVHSSGRVFVNLDERLFISDTSGNNWKTNIYSWTYTMDSKENIYSCASNQGLQISKDTAKTWTYLGLQGAFVFDLLTVEDSCIFAASQNGVYISRDYGLTWKLVDPGISNGSSAWRFAKDSHNNVFVITHNELFIGRDMGRTWTKINYPGLTLSEIFVEAGDELVIGCEKGMFTSSDFGQTWIYQGIDKDILAYFLSPVGDKFVGTFEHIFRKGNGTDQWSESDVGVNQCRISSVIKNGNNLFVVSNGEFSISTDNGVSWKKPFEPKWGFAYLEYVDTKGRIVGNVDYRQAYSIDNGVTWTEFISPQSELIYKTADVNGDTIFATTNTNSVYLSSDFGKHWKKIWQGDAKSYVNFMKLDKENNLFFNLGKDLYKYSWKDKSVSLIGTFDDELKSVAFDFFNQIYAASRDNIYIRGIGDTWEKVGPSFYNTILDIFFAEGNEFYVITNQGISLSVDFGKSYTVSNIPFYWQFLTSSFYSVQGVFYVGTQENGIYKVSISPSTVEIPSDSYLLNNYPNPFNNQTTIQFFLDQPGEINFSIFNSIGQKVETLAQSYAGAGFYKINWSPKTLASGVYFYRLQTPNFVETKKMVYLK